MLNCCDIRRATSAIFASPASPCKTASGTNPATESSTTNPISGTSSISRTISSACSALSGCDIIHLSRLKSTPSAFAYSRSSACSVSTYPTAFPSVFCTDALRCNAAELLPLENPPYISCILPSAKPPPNISSNAMLPEDTVSTFISLPTTASFPKRFSILPNNSSNPIITPPLKFPFLHYRSNRSVRKIP